MIDILTIGRCSVDLYGKQVGGRLEDMRSFNKYVGGSPANIAIGCARLGMRSALLSRVGDEHMGRFIREQLIREGVDTSYLKTDPENLTALVVLGIRDEERFPLIFYRENCADMALSEDDVDEDLIRRCRMVLATGTHLSHPQTRAAVIKALAIARREGVTTALDIDYRPNLWGLAGHNAGEERYIASENVTRTLQSHLSCFDLIVGTEEEITIAGGEKDAFSSIQALRERTSAVIICKRGALGAVVYADAINGQSLDDGEAGRKFSVDIYNVLGAGDGFMAGLIWGRSRNKSWARALGCANACGALAVSRHGCAPAYPSRTELEWFMDKGVTQSAVRKDVELDHIHRVTNRRRPISDINVFAFDHRGMLEALAEQCGVESSQIVRFKELCLTTLHTIQSDHATTPESKGPSYGIICDDDHGRKALYKAVDHGLWVARPVEIPGSRPLRLILGDDFGSDLSEWPTDHVVKVLCRAHSDDDQGLKDNQYGILSRLFYACKGQDLELLIEIVAPSDKPVSDVSCVMQSIYARGIRPDWWKLEPTNDQGSWQAIEAIIAAEDPWCQGIILPCLSSMPNEKLAALFHAAARHKRVKGFATGSSVFMPVAESWLRNSISDADAIVSMRTSLLQIANAWNEARKKSPTTG